MFTFFHQTKAALFDGLAREQVLLEPGGCAAPALFVWRSPRAVVLGKNQNPWKECDLNWIRANGLHIARRISGGGTVYHDPGNLNLAWIVDRQDYKADTFHGWLRNALHHMGLPAETNCSGATFVEGAKVSGSAYCYRRDKVLHHATLLLRADLSALRMALAPPPLSLQTHAIDSIPAPVANLLDLKPSLTEPDLLQALLASAEQCFGPVHPADLSGLSIESARQTLQSRDWILGQTPAFTCCIQVAGTPLKLSLRNARVLQLNGQPVSPLPFDASLPDQLAPLAGLSAAAILQAFAAEGWVLGVCDSSSTSHVRDCCP